MIEMTARELMYEAYSFIKGMDEARRTALEDGNTDMAESIGESINNVRESIKEKGPDYMRTYRELADAWTYDNVYIVINEDITSEKDVVPTLKRFQEHGIRRFIYGGKYSRCGEMVWAFVNNGCQIVGMTEYNGHFRDLDGEYEKLHGFVLELPANGIYFGDD